MKKALISFPILFLFSSLLSAAGLTDLSVEQVQTMKQDKDVLIVDVRTGKEWQSTGIIPGSHPLEFFDPDGHYDSKKWLSQLQQLKSSPDQKIILVCRSGNRSGMVGNFLAQKLGMKNIYHLSTGIRSWIKAGKKVAPVCPDSIVCKK